MDADLIGEMNDGRGETPPPFAGDPRHKGDVKKEKTHNVNAKTLTKDSSILFMVFYDKK